MIINNFKCHGGLVLVHYWNNGLVDSTRLRLRHVVLIRLHFAPKRKTNITFSVMLLSLRLSAMATMILNSHYILIWHTWPQLDNFQKTHLIGGFWKVFTDFSFANTQTLTKSQMNNFQIVGWKFKRFPTTKSEENLVKVVNLKKSQTEI